VIADGRHPVIVKSVDAAKSEMTFDLIVFLTGDEAKAEFKKRFPSEDGPPNDYFTVNDNPKLRTVQIASGATVKLLDEANPTDPAVATLDQLAANAADRLCWITVASGSIVAIEEQFVP
jgi:hypothetical protein